jgi:G3E family GTPase
VVNEFGEVGIDGALLQEAGTDVVEMTSGCICCTLSADLIQSLRDVHARFSPRRIFIECTGVADPTAVTAVLKEPALAQKMTLTKVVTVLDADFWQARENFGALFYNQLGAANLILLNKVDLLEKEKISDYLREIHEVIPDAQVVPTIHCGIDPQTLWSKAAPKGFGLKPIQFFRPVGAGTGSSQAGAGRTVDASGYVTFSYESDAVLDVERFGRFLGKLPWEVFRVKGPVRFQDGTRVLNFVGGKYDWMPWNGSDQNRLAFIGWGVSAADVLDRLKSCLV